ncbi:MAG: SH3 domain-containing protein [Clostridia bacterium]|nr:SH3 domain-containing protein [Clostridia bacterium]
MSNLMKKTVLLAAVMMALMSVASFAQAEIIPPYGEGQIGLTSVVLCESLTVRQEHSNASKATETLEYGRRIIVINRVDGWAQICVSDDCDGGPIGWVNADYLAIDPAWYRTDEATAVYAWNDTAAPKVALLNADTVLPILKDEGDWLIVSLRGATGWIRKTASDR